MLYGFVLTTIYSTFAQQYFTSIEGSNNSCLSLIFAMVWASKASVSSCLGRHSCHRHGPKTAEITSQEQEHVLVSTTPKEFQTVYEREIWCLCSLKWNSSLIYYSWLYCIFLHFATNIYKILCDLYDPLLSRLARVPIYSMLLSNCRKWNIFSLSSTVLDLEVAI